MKTKKITRPPDLQFHQVLDIPMLMKLTIVLIPEVIVEIGMNASNDPIEEIETEKEMKGLIGSKRI